MLIERCTFDTGDDCIALKSGRNDDGRRVNVPVENVVIRDCVMKDGHGGVVIGSEISGGARNIFAERCRMDSPQLDRVAALQEQLGARRPGRAHLHARRHGGPGGRSDRRRRLLLRGRRQRHAYADLARRRSPQRDEPEEPLRAAPARLRARADLRHPRHRLPRSTGSPRAIDWKGVRDVVFSNVRINGTVRNERVTRGG